MGRTYISARWEDTTSHRRMLHTWMCILLCLSAATGCVVGAVAALPGKAVALARAAAVEREVGTSGDAGFGWPAQRPKCPAQYKAVYFAHVRKTGGTIVVRQLLDMMSGVRRAKPCHNRAICSKSMLSLMKQFPTGCRFLETHCDARFFRDHVKRSGRGGQITPPILGVTMLRHPLDRMISAYFFTPSLPKNYGKKPESEGGGFFGFLNDTAHKDLHDKGPTQRWHGLNHMAAYFAGITRDTDGARGESKRSSIAVLKDEAELLARAKKGIDQFCVVGIYDDLKGSLQLMGKALGLNPPRISLFRVRYNASRRRSFTVSPEASAYFEKLHAVDIALYEYAIELFRKQKAAVDAAYDAVKNTEKTISRTR